MQNFRFFSTSPSYITDFVQFFKGKPSIVKKFLALWAKCNIWMAPINSKSTFRPSSWTKILIFPFPSFLQITETQPLDLQGPIFLNEPKYKVEFSNNSGGHIDCSGHGNPYPEVSEFWFKNHCKNLIGLVWQRTQWISNSWRFLSNFLWILGFWENYETSDATEKVCVNPWVLKKSRST